MIRVSKACVGPEELKAIEEVFGGCGGPVGDLDQVAVGRPANCLLNVADLDLGAEVHVWIRREVEHPQDLGFGGRNSAHLMNA